MLTDELSTEEADKLTAAPVGFKPLSKADQNTLFIVFLFVMLLVFVCIGGGLLMIARNDDNFQKVTLTFIGTIIFFICRDILLTIKGRFEQIDLSRKLDEHSQAAVSRGVVMMDKFRQVEEYTHSVKHDLRQDINVVGMAAQVAAKKAMRVDKKLNGGVHKAVDEAIEKKLGDPEFINNLAAKVADKIPCEDLADLVVKKMKEGLSSGQ